MKRTIWFVVGGMMVSCLVLAGCKKAGEEAAEKAIEAGMAKQGLKADVDVSGEKVTINSKDGKTEFSSGENAAVPKDFPKDVYVYEGAAIKAAISVPGGCNLAMETSDSSDKVLATIKSKMNGYGWKQEMNMNQGEHSMVTYKKGERSTVVNINAGGKTTQINLTTTGEKG